ncbi:MAG: DUF2577 domain-containing protein [Lawsonibacter sp.]|nr:DUF2577 domain-containing protein [Lawsonibacter sp.]
MLEQIKRISKQTGEAETPTRFLFGTVTKLSPLTVFVDSRFYLTGPGLVVLKELSGHHHTVPKQNTEETQLHSHMVPEQTTEDTGALAVGDKVVLLRNQGGQQYLILGRV